MIRSFIALFVALFFALASIVAPAYADTTILENSSQVKDAQWSIFWIKPEDVQTFINEVGRNSSAVIETVRSSIPSIEINPEYVDEFVKEAVRNSGAVIGTVGTGVAICYIADGLATTAFPPDAALLPYCPAVSAITGGSSQVIRQFLVNFLRNKLIFNF